MKSYASDIAVPAWGAFMRDATRGHRAVWYDLPSDVEKVEICRASGHRAGEACRRSPGFARVMLMDGTTVDRPVEGGVTTELFTLGSAPYGECPIHSGLYLDTATALSPMPDMTIPADYSTYPAYPTYPASTAQAPLPDPLATQPVTSASSPLFRASEAVGTSGVTRPPAAPTPSVAPPASLPPMPTSPSLPNARPQAPPTSLGTMPKAGLPTLPGQPVRKPGGGLKVEKVARP